MRSSLSYFLVSFFSAATCCAEPERERVTLEPLLFTGETKVTATAQLLHLPQAAPELVSGDLSANFSAGKDFTWEAGTRTLKLTADSRIPFKTSAELHPAPNAPNAYKAQRGTDAWMFFGPGRVLHDLQCKADYVSADDWKSPAVTPASDEQLGKIRTKLAAKQPLNLVLLGDSISTGADASAISKAEPNQPGYPELVTNGLNKHFGAKVTLTNLSVGGMDSKWGLTQVPKVIAAKPDIFLLAFGMNDASGKRTPQELVRLAREIYTPVQAAFPECAVVLISPMTANHEWTGASPELYPQYAAALATLTGPGIALANVTPVWTAIAERKRYLDLSGNGLNHPNDYGHRIYADVILTTFGAVKTP
jgi:acyl-CoA thioesterase-1